MIIREFQRLIAALFTAADLLFSRRGGGGAAACRRRRLTGLVADRPILQELVQQVLTNIRPLEAVKLLELNLGFLAKSDWR